MSNAEPQSAEALIGLALTNANYITKHTAPDTNRDDAIAGAIAAVAISNAAIAAAILESRAG